MREYQLKENMMEKNIQTEQQLSEEQLQEITGGCRRCALDIVEADKQTTYATTYSNLANTALESQAHIDTDRYLRAAALHSALAQQLRNGVVDRHRRVLSSLSKP